MPDGSLIIEYKNSRPMELAVLTVSLSALADQFKRYAIEDGRLEPDARLYVREIRSGSVIAELVALGQVVNDLYEAREHIAGFFPVLVDAMKVVQHLLPEAKKIDRATVKNVSNIVAPIALDNGSQLSLIDNQGGVINNYYITSSEAATIRHNAQHLLNSQFPEELRFENEPMTLFQMRNAPPGRAGDYGVIDRFDGRAKKLTFTNDGAKDAILHHEGNPFERIFWVSGVVKTTGGDVAGYQIDKLDDVSDKGV
jgi:hypothetical protein